MPAGQTAPETVLKLSPVPPRVVAVDTWRGTTDEEALQTLADPAFVPYSTVLLPRESGVPAPPTLTAPTEPARVEVSRVQPGRYEFTVENAAPVVVRVAEKYDPNWKATVDGKTVPVVRADYMFQGLYLPEAGRHEIVLRNAPGQAPVLLQSIGLLIGMGAAVWLLAGRFRRIRPGRAELSA